MRGRARPQLCLAFALPALLAIGCGGVPADAGLGAELQVAEAQFNAGPMPASAGGPAVVSFYLQSNAAYAGEIEDPASGALGPTATAALLGLSGDLGYWTLPAGLPSAAAPAYPTFSALLSFAESLPAGSYTLTAEAVDASGNAGDPNTATLTVAAAPEPSGALVVTLRWDSESDLDLHVVDPAGSEIFWGDPSPPGSGGALDVDSNAQCVIDGRRREDVVFASGPPPGTYVVRVDTSSLCAASYAYWNVEAVLHGAVVARAEGESTETSTELSHGVGAGVQALTLHVP
jgi:hypothetical protein